MLFDNHLVPIIAEVHLALAAILQSDSPDAEFAELLEDAANRLLDISDEINATILARQKA